MHPPLNDKGQESLAGDAEDVVGEQHLRDKAKGMQESSSTTMTEDEREELPIPAFLDRRQLRPTDAIRIGVRHRQDLGDINSLAESISDIGLLHPIVVNQSGELIAGARRLAACKKLGWREVPVRVVDLTKIIKGELAENIYRKNLQPSEIETIRRAILSEEKAEATSRKLSGRSAPNGGETRDKIGAFAGVSGRTVEKIAAVVAAADAEPEKYGKLVADMDRTGRVNGVFKRLVVARKAEAIRREPPALPGKGPYPVIVADPPWPYEIRSESQRGTYPYPAMSIEQIKALDVGGIAAPNCILWLWTTNFHMPEAFGVLAAWGFSHKTILTWVKPRIGLGAWLRGQTEHCIFATRGSPVVSHTAQSTLLYGPVREHSRKPDEFYALVEALCPGCKVELFQRYPREGWCGHGDEVGAAGTTRRRRGHE